MSFFLEYLKHPIKVGAIAPSSKFLARKMVKPIDFSSCNCIVEYGPGTGIFTNEIIKRKRKNTVFLVIEQNQKFYEKLFIKYGLVPNLILINGSAENLEKYMSEYNIKSVDYIVSGLPFTSLPKKVSETILSATKRAIGKNGKFITFQYTLFKKKFFENYFKIKNVTLVFKNLPPAYVLEMKNR